MITLRKEYQIIYDMVSKYCDENKIKYELCEFDDRLNRGQMLLGLYVYTNYNQIYETEIDKLINELDLHPRFTQLVTYIYNMKEYKVNLQVYLVTYILYLIM